MLAACMGVCVGVYVCVVHACVRARADGWVGVFMYELTLSGGNARSGGAGLHAQTRHGAYGCETVEPVPFHVWRYQAGLNRVF
jgi:hypothetical protein